MDTECKLRWLIQNEFTWGTGYLDIISRREIAPDQINLHHEIKTYIPFAALRLCVKMSPRPPRLRVALFHTQLAHLVL